MNELTSPAPAQDEVTPRSDTRARIQEVALELFAEQGYDKTSLREIAERLGVTKAALYYHFKSKEDIVAGLASDYFDRLEELAEWGRGQPKTPGFRAEFLRRYFDIADSGTGVFRMLEQNQASVNSLAHDKSRSAQFRDRMRRLVEALTGPGAPLREEFRATMAVASVSFGRMLYADRASDPAELRDVVLRTAYELADARTSGSTR